MMLRPKSTTDIRRLQGISTVATRLLPPRPGEQLRGPRLVVVPRPAAGGEQPLLVAGEPRHRQVVPVPPERQHAAGLEHPERLADRPVRVGPVERLRVGHEVELSVRQRQRVAVAHDGQHPRRRPRAEHPHHAVTRIDRGHGGAAAGDGPGRDAGPGADVADVATTATAAPSPTPARRRAAPGSRAGRRRSRPRRRRTAGGRSRTVTPSRRPPQVEPGEREPLREVGLALVPVDGPAGVDLQHHACPS